jgi:hypothetical protein
VAWSVPQRPSLLVIAAVFVGAAGCGGHGNKLAQATQCLRDGHARPHPLPPALSNPLRESGWRTRTFAVGSNDLVVVAADSDAAAGQARQRLARASEAVGPNAPPPHRRGRFVYAWAERPSPADRALVSRCIG